MSSEDILAKFDELVKRFKEELNEIIQGERAKMKAEVEQYNAEKQRMKPFEVSDDDIIHLNVGGQKLTSTRSTLCQVEGSLLQTFQPSRFSRDCPGLDYVVPVSRFSSYCSGFCSILIVVFFK
jgi:hypothetical protein